MPPLRSPASTKRIAVPPVFASLGWSSTAAEGGQNQAFAFGLDRILDGLEALIDRRAARE